MEAAATFTQILFNTENMPFLNLLFLNLALILAPFTSANAFPELIRHGYVNCVSCHVSPSGGGLMNDYGRSFSREGLSAFSTPNEHGLLQGLVDPKSLPKWLTVGGNFRGAQVHRENEFVREGRFYVMQADLEAAVKMKSFTFDFTASRVQTGTAEPRLKSRRFFVMYDFNDEQRIRAGRFLPNYGVNIAEHIAVTRAPLGFDQGQEYLAIEASHITGTWNVFVTSARGPLSSPEVHRESALASQIAYNFHDTHKIGVNLWHGRSEATQRQLGGVFASLGFSERWHLLSELDWRWLTFKANDAHSRGFFAYNRLSYEFTRGLLGLTTIEFLQPVLETGSTASDRLGVGLQAFPRPHLDLQLMWTKVRRRNRMVLEDYAWLMLHYYL